MLYGIEMAKAFNARLILFSAYQMVPIPVTESALILASEDMKNVTSKLLDQEVQFITTGNKLRIETMCEEGLAPDAILKAAQESKADLIITGMKALGKGLKKVFGSTVTTLTKKVTIPMIVVPEGSKYAAIDTIAVANDSDLPPNTNRQLLYSLQYIAERFHSKVYIVRVLGEGFSESYEWRDHPVRLEKMIRTLDPVYERVEGKDVPASLKKFIKGYRVNLLAILPHKHSLLKSLFMKHTTTSMVFESDIPLLIIPQSNKRMAGYKQLKKLSLES